VFFLLLQDERYTLPEDLFKACRELRLSETKVRRLYQDTQLRYMQYDEEEAKKRFIGVVESCFPRCGQNPGLLTRQEAVHVFERKKPRICGCFKITSAWSRTNVYTCGKVDEKTSGI